VKIRTEVHSAAAVVIIDYPERRNALSPQLMRDLLGALEDAGRDRGVCGIVLTGEGAFSAGGDIKQMSRRLTATEAEGIDPVYRQLIMGLLDLPVPTVAAIDGPAVGLGFDLALACDSRFIGPQGWCRHGWSRIGILPGSGGIALLQRCSPGALWKLIDGEPTIDGPTAERLGLAEAVLSQTARERAIERINTYASIPRPTLEAYVTLDRADLKQRLPAHFDAVGALQQPLLESDAFHDRLRQRVQPAPADPPN